MAAHLSHKIRWDFLAAFHTPYLHKAITLPVGDCGLIHATKKKHQIQVEMRKFISEDMICRDIGCPTTGERDFRKSYQKGAPFSGTGDERKLKMFASSLYSVIHEFATTELECKPKPVQHESTESALNGGNSFTFCDHCNTFIHDLEFGNKENLLAYTGAELNCILNCIHGGQAVGNSIRFLLHNILRFYIYSNLIVHLDLRTEDLWPEFMRSDSYFRRSLTYPCDGQTFLPHNRHLLANAMVDLDETRKLSKRLFRFLYFYVMIRLKFDSSYNLEDDFDYGYFR